MGAGGGGAGSIDAICFLAAAILWCRCSARLMLSWRDELMALKRSQWHRCGAAKYNPLLETRKLNCAGHRTALPPPTQWRPGTGPERPDY